MASGTYGRCVGDDHLLLPFYMVGALVTNHVVDSRRLLYLRHGGGGGGGGPPPDV